MIKNKKKKLLVFTSTFPRWKNDPNPPFVYELSRRLTKPLDISVLAPHYSGAKTFEELDNMKVFRFKYFLEKYEKLTGNIGILPSLRKNKLFYLLVPFFLIAGFFALRRQIKENRPDVIHAHWIIPQGLIASFIKKMYGVPFVITTHGGDIYGLQGKLLTAIKKFILRNASKITVVSSAIKKEILEKIDSNLDINVISMGVDSKLFGPDKMDYSIRKEYKINGPFLLFVGRLAEKKGVEYLIKAMPNILYKFPETKLMIIGAGALESKLKNLTKNLNLEKNIIFMGAIPNVFLTKYYASADIFIGPSIQEKGGDTEGLGLTFVEAGLSNCVLIGSNIGGIPDVIEENKTGSLVKQKSSQAISCKVIELLENKSLMIKIKKQVRTNLIEKFDWEIVSNKYERILR